MNKTQNYHAKWIILFSMVVSLSLIFLDQTAVPIALEAIKNSVHATMNQLQWILNIYILTLAVFIIPGGKLADLVGNRKIFYLGSFLFALGSALFGFSKQIDFLIFARAVQGLGAAFMLPASGVLLFNAFDLNERGKAMGIYIASASLFLAVGPVIGGIIIEHSGWQWLFLINLPFILISILGIYFARTPEQKKTSGLTEMDWPGICLLILTLVPLVFSLMQVKSFGWTSPYFFALLFLSFAAFIFFIRTERKKSSPLIDLQLFKNTAFKVSVLLIVLTQISIIAIAFWPILLGNIYQLTAEQIGYMLLFATIPVMVISPKAGKLMDRKGPRLPVALGFVTLATGAIWISLTVWFQDYKLLLPGFFIYGCGPSFLMASVMTYMMSSCEPRKRGEVAGLASFFRQVGGTLGITLMSTMISNLHAIKALFFSGSPAFIPNYDLIQTNQLALCLLMLMVLFLALGTSFVLKFLPDFSEETHLREI